MIYLLYKALQGTIKCLQRFKIPLYKANIYNENNAYRPLALAGFKGKECKISTLSFLSSEARDSKKNWSCPKKWAANFIPAVTHKHKITFFTERSLSELAEVYSTETIVAGKQQITPRPSSTLFKIQLILLQEGRTAHPVAMPATQAGPQMQFSQLSPELDSCTSYQGHTNSSESMGKM